MLSAELQFLYSSFCQEIPQHVSEPPAQVWLHHKREVSDVAVVGAASDAAAVYRS